MSWSPRYWSRLATASAPLFWVLFLYPPFTIPLFTPAQIIDDSNFIPFLFGPWSWPVSLGAQASRLVQACLLGLFPVSTSSCYQLWICIAVLRTILGYILTRSVGWAYPRLLSHSALYERCGGFGPSLVAYFHLKGGLEVKTLHSRFHKVGDLTSLVVLSTLFATLDGSPWTYALAIVGATAVVVAPRFFRRTTAIARPLLPDGRSHVSATKFRAMAGSALLSLGAILISSQFPVI